MPSPRNPTNWFSKFFESLYFFIALSELFYGSFTTFLSKLISIKTESAWTNLFVISMCGFLTITLVYSIWWQINEQKPSFNSGRIHAWLQGILRYFLAYQISVYGFAKLLKTQFAVSYSRNDIPVGNLSGFDLTWNYFGYDHTFAVILGLIQIGGSFMLLFKQTRLMGVFILLPVMVNIVLINVFYHIAAGAFIMSLILTFGLIYLLLLRWNDIKALFLSHPVKLPVGLWGYGKLLLKLLTITAAFLTIYSYIANDPPSSVLTGKWKVQEFKRNGKLVDLTKWQDSTGLWENIYIEERGKIVLSSNPYVFDESSAVTAGYSYDAKGNKLVLFLNGIINKTDTEVMAISHYDGKKMEWSRVFNGDTAQYKLTKAE